MFTTCAFYFQNNISRMIFRLNAVKTVKNTHCGYIKLINDNKLINGITYNLIWRGTEVSAEMNSSVLVNEERSTSPLNRTPNSLHSLQSRWPLTSQLSPLSWTKRGQRWRPFTLLCFIALLQKPHRRRFRLDLWPEEALMNTRCLNLSADAVNNTCIH